MKTEPDSAWRAFGKSVRGASHIRDNRPNQDAILWSSGESDGLPLVMALSDGHGSQRSFRSETGAAFAVDAISTCLTDFARQLFPSSQFKALEQDARKNLPRELEYRWKRTVLDHLTTNQFSNEEIETLYVYQEKNEGEPPILNPFLAYGATALGVLVTQSYRLYLQLGDGDMLNVYSDGKTERPLPDDPRLIGNATTSLCARKAAQDVRLSIQFGDRQIPELILVSTDGYANSFKNDEEFLRVGPDILDIIRTDGLDYIERHLGDWLEETTQVGSGDDITLGILSNSVVNLPEVETLKTTQLSTE
ncbi:MAG: protein phosphatase 2C domain-containing protein [Candidatus Nitronauta litoralis]|uniref:Protein phosphatase 2C domain-containing protein n=1 Tax=Candidatus Nitronauta litoralis TaxID=2705533 RepID=A0A7T0BT75_9BACT|nr:MAG: protein phosphatase 2C domain-containing protein [Candidatus Nitronauta litoralis]